ncbi:S41 family peptidase [Crocinitomicaceae bacterium CZZ-1]|uniref:S41 family peptidase n=1 Tax=Taishania pollutisoli TaxID=2766479 RepID=A0A8J6U1B3_9FLAO|nr:S41 family peptidase [Taishania pollutisoli]MBC9813883.1 S41 family peptidase [Taishania pollutisoli]MBX2950042.1 S41 family peptidase [Crocinitomicaceae bacterium]
MKKFLLPLICLSISGLGFSQNRGNKFDEVYNYVSKLYVDEVNNEELLDAAVIAMLEKLDPHSTYISKEEVEDANQAIVGSFVGIGVRFQVFKDTFTIMQTIPGGPSEKVGLQSGDKLIRVDGETIAGVGLKNSQIRERLMGDLNTKVKVDVVRKNEKEPLSFTITRDKIPVHSVDAAYMIDKNIGYIKLNSFSRTTTEEIENSIKQLKEQGMKDLILDLQNNGGGLLSAAHELADQFLSGDKMIVYSEGRAQPRQEFKTAKKDAFEKGRLIILTNENSASASEIVSGAIQDWDRGLIVGRRTFGKGLVQRPINLMDGSQIRLTIARYFTPSGRFIQKPYENNEEYKKDLNNRYEHGEYYHQDSIKLNDSLKVKTLMTGRTVYGGGGIMPDVFVAYDTTGVSPFFSSLIRKGAINTYLAQYVNNNRASLKQQYPTFEKYKKEFNFSQAFMDDFFKYAAEDHKIEFNEEEYKESEQLMKLNMKAVFAQSLFDTPQFYEIINDSNEVLTKAIEILNSDQYKNAGLEKGK